MFLETQSYSFACVARNHEVELVAAKSICRAGMVPPEVVETLASKEAMSWIDTTQWSRIIIETYCLIAVQGIRSTLVVESYFGGLIHDCRT